VVDAFDAMMSPRLYREPLSVEDALGELESGAGSQFDPELVARLAGLVRGGDVVPQQRERPPADAATFLDDRDRLPTGVDPASDETPKPALGSTPQRRLQWS
jgi:HD-GYP domain-containing protein (c-di-GMP phosphodiesterase class II)